MNNAVRGVHSIAAILQEARLNLMAALALNPADAALEARVLLSHTLEQDRSYLIAYSDTEISKEQQLRFQILLHQRCEGMPVAYLTGQREFYGLNFAVTPAVLIPRPETELLVDIALEHIPPTGPLNILDLGTGSGAIAITLAKLRPQAQMTAVDASPAALTVARGNASRHEVSHIQFIESDWFSHVKPQSHYDLIVANPPYVAQDDSHAQNGDLRFEPQTALLAGEDGLAALRAIVDSASLFLKPGGRLLIEHGFDQRQACLDLFASSGFSGVQAFDDLANQPRCLIGKISG